MDIANLIVLPELEDYLEVPTAEQDAELEQFLAESNGPYDSIKVWKGRDIIIDGMRRYKICQRRGWAFSVTEIECDDIDDAKYWMDRFQSKRRNNTPHANKMALARMLAHKERKAGLTPGADARADADVRKGFGGSARRGTVSKRREALDEVAADAGVSDKSVRRAEKYAKAFELLITAIKNRIVAGELKLSEPDTIELATYSHEEQAGILAQFDAGEFSSIGEAMNGTDDGAGGELVGEDAYESLDDCPVVEEGPSPNLPRYNPPPKKPGKPTSAAEDLLEVQKALGRLLHCLDIWHSSSGDTANYKLLKNQFLEGAETLDELARTRRAVGAA